MSSSESLCLQRTIQGILSFEEVDETFFMLAYQQRNWAMLSWTLERWDWNKASQMLHKPEVTSSSWNPQGIGDTYAGFILQHQPKRDLCAAANEKMYVNVPMNVIENWMCMSESIYKT